MRLLIVLVLLLVGLAGCGGERGTPRQQTPPVNQNPPPASPFGLTSRASLAPPAIPLTSGSLGSYALEESFPNLSFPNAILLSGIPGDSRLALVQQSGQISVFADDSGVTASQVRLVLDLSARVLFFREQGLLGLAFDPDFAQNRYLYVHYSMAPDVPNPGDVRRSVIARFSWDSATDQVVPASEKILLEIPQPFGNHNGGALAFGPDDFLYIALGDGGSGNDPQDHAQNPADLLGSLLRIDVHPANPADPYDVPSDNPFVSTAGFRPEIWAYGLRNPFRFSFDRNTGDLWLGDVGQSAREEIDLIERGGNYGWRVFEGTLATGLTSSGPNSSYLPPVLDYNRSQGVAVIGGYVYRGNRVPSLQGRYLYTDFGTGTVWALQYDRATGAVVANDVISTANSPTSFGEDLQGEVYLISQNAGLFHFEERTAGTGSEPPVLLSQTGLFSDLSTLTPVQGLIEYGVNLPFWSDGTRKRRWIGVPDGQQITFAATGAWQFPLGTVLVKHFELDLVEGDPSSSRRLETRVLVQASDGWRGFTYRWNGVDADLLTAREQETITVTLAAGGSRDQLYEYPSRTDCLGCHTQAAGRVLGIRTRQQNGDFTYPAAVDNQLRSWNNIGLFTADIGAADQYQRFPALNETAVPMTERARAYLAVNCAQCHQPGGLAPVPLDLRFDVAAADMLALNEVPSAGDLGVTDARIIAPGDRNRSVLWLRMTALDGDRMPPLGSHVVDDEGAQLIGAWIDTL